MSSSRSTIAAERAPLPQWQHPARARVRVFVFVSAKVRLHVANAHVTRGYRMQAAVACDYGGLDRIAVCECETAPVAGENEVLIRVNFASVNPVDWKMLSGYLALIESGGATKRRIRGFDACGEIVAMGKNCTRLVLGDKVICMLHFSQVAQGRGTFAELVAVNEK